ncbi:MAG TPA: ABC transporter ATP-binding protein [Alphaproteobacteria bacterium]|nr:ABC transporter ATP-binding protein [Alphaproteobacteria bacterium]
MTSSASPQPIIRLEGVELTLPSAAGMVNILRGIDLAVQPGESVGVVGPSGSGKSTMVMIMAGLERATKGRVTVGGADYAAMNEDELALFRRNNIGIVFQSFHLVPAMTALENVAIPLELAGERDAFERAAAELQNVGLGHRLTHYPSQMSGGEQQRVALARAFATQPKLILADEPTGNLDGANGRAVVDLLFGAQARLGTTLVLITHDAALAEHCHRVLRMEDGKIAGESAGTAQYQAAQ